MWLNLFIVMSVNGAENPGTQLDNHDSGNNRSHSRYWIHVADGPGIMMTSRSQLWGDTSDNLVVGISFGSGAAVSQHWSWWGRHRLSLLVS